MQQQKLTDVLNIFSVIVSVLIPIGLLWILNDAMLLKNEGYFGVPQLPASFWIIGLTGISILVMVTRKNLQKIEFIKIIAPLLFVGILVIVYKFSKRHVALELVLLCVLVATSLFTLLNVLLEGQISGRRRASVLSLVFCCVTALSLLLFFMYPVRQGKLSFFNLHLKNENFDASIKIQNIYLSGAVLEGCKFNETIFLDVDVIEAEIVDVTFSECKLENITFDGTVFAKVSSFYKCVFTNTKFLENVDMPNISFAGSTFGNKTLLNGNYEGSDFRCCKFKPGVIIPHLEKFDGRYIKLDRMVQIDGIGSITNRINNLPHMEILIFDCSTLPDGEVLIKTSD